MNSETSNVALGLVLRLVPGFVDPGIALRDDAAFHERMVRATLERGRVPELDCTWPPPRSIARWRRSITRRRAHTSCCSPRWRGR